MIPKIIHYCWFGGNKLPAESLKCIQSWKEKASDYQIIRWDESNFEIESLPRYVQEAYQCKKWAFVTDYVRLKIIFEYGGIYLDTDVELKKSFNSFLKYHAFFAREDVSNINTGLGFGAEKGSKIVSDLMKDYEDIHFIKPDGDLDITPCPERNRHVFKDYGAAELDRKQVLKDSILILPTIYMCPLSYQTGKMRHSFKTVSVHWFSASWKEKEERETHWNYVKKKNKEEKLDYIKHFPNRILIKLLGVKNYSRLKRKIKHAVYKAKYYCLLILPSCQLTSTEAENKLITTSRRPVGSCVGKNEILPKEKLFDLQIIIPAYNVENYILDCLQSVVENMQQTSYRVIATIVNDGSTDGTSSIIKRFLKEVDRKPILNCKGIEQSFQYIDQKNKGFSGARNTALKVLRGRYITFLDSDDLFVDGAVEKLISVGYQGNFDIVQGNMIRMNSQGQEFQMEEFKKLSGYPCGKIYKNVIFQHFQFPEGYWFEDTPLSFFLFYIKLRNGESPRSKIIKENVYCYRINPNGITSTAWKKNKCIDTYYITELCLKEFPRFKVPYDLRAYKYFLNQTVMNAERMRNLSENIRKAVFAKECNLREIYFKDFRIKNESKLHNIERALQMKKFELFEFVALGSYK